MGMCLFRPAVLEIAKDDTVVMDIVFSCHGYSIPASASEELLCGHMFGV